MERKEQTFRGDQIQFLAVEDVSKMYRWEISYDKVQRGNPEDALCRGAGILVLAEAI